MAKETKEPAELFVGIDLGTSRSAISTSQGKRFMIESYVGWPVDMVARKVLKRPILIGQEAIENRSMLELHRPLESGLLKEGSDKDQQAVRQLLSHLLKKGASKRCAKQAARSGQSSVYQPRLCASTANTFVKRCADSWTV
jgi:hypothetical protein